MLPPVCRLRLNQGLLDLFIVFSLFQIHFVSSDDAPVKPNLAGKLGGLDLMA